MARQLDAYNARDIEAFMASWSLDAVMLAWPDTVLERGARAIRARHIARFQEPALYARLVSRTAIGAMVVDHEQVTRMFHEGVREIDVIAIYEVLDGLIRRAWFQQGKPRMPGGGL